MYLDLGFGVDLWMYGSGSGLNLFGLRLPGRGHFSLGGFRRVYKVIGLGAYRVYGCEFGVAASLGCRSQEGL